MRYPASLFLVGCIMNFFRNCLLNIAMLVLLLVGIWSRPCLYIGLVLLGINLILAFIAQLRLKRAIMKGFEDTEEEQQFKDIIFDPNWVDNVKDYTEDKINKNTDLTDYKDYTVLDDDKESD